MNEIPQVGPRSRVFRAVVKPIYKWGQRTASAAIDRRWGVRTTPGIGRRALGVPSERQHKPYGWLSVERVFRRYPLRPDDVLVDIGSGSGRVTLVAARRFRCRRIIGIERDAALADVARGNVRDCRRELRTPVELITDDALTWSLPPDTSVIFFNNPFDGARFRELVRRIVESLDHAPRRLLFLYGNPREADYLAGSDHFTLVNVLQWWRPRADWARTTSMYVYEVQHHGSPANANHRTPPRAAGARRKARGTDRTPVASPTR